MPPVRDLDLSGRHGGELHRLGEPGRRGGKTALKGGMCMDERPENRRVHKRPSVFRERRSIGTTRIGFAISGGKLEAFF